ncbi:MAG: hypothetical protein ACE5OZ_23200 [Candidatus Heimdallarchaeota archaeon]
MRLRTFKGLCKAYQAENTIYTKGRMEFLDKGIVIVADIKEHFGIKPDCIVESFTVEAITTGDIISQKTTKKELKGWLEFLSLPDDVYLARMEKDWASVNSKLKSSKKQLG